MISHTYEDHPGLNASPVNFLLAVDPAHDIYRYTIKKGNRGNALWHRFWTVCSTPSAPLHQTCEERSQCLVLGFAVWSSDLARHGRFRGLVALSFLRNVMSVITGSEI